LCKFGKYSHHFQIFLNKIFAEMSIKQRLDLIVKELGLSGRAFEKECGLANGSYSSIRDGVGADKLNKIMIRYPQISADWLICGTGEMMKKEKFEKNETEFENLGSIFARNISLPRNNINRDEMKTVLFQMAGIISGHQQEISRLITELEQNGKRSDRLIDIIEQGITRNEEPVTKREPVTFNQQALRAD
jgi:hypothetical protein